MMRAPERLRLWRSVIAGLDITDAALRLLPCVAERRGAVRVQVPTGAGKLKQAARGIGGVADADMPAALLRSNEQQGAAPGGGHMLGADCLIHRVRDVRADGDGVRGVVAVMMAVVVMHSVMQHAGEAML